MIDWQIEGRVFGNCNCAYGCPCQFEALPTYGDCRGFEALTIDRGHFGSTDLTGLRSVLIDGFPGPVFEGRGEMQVVIDERADSDQRAALETVMHGGETREAATHWWVYHTMCETVHEVLYKPIHLEIDIDARVARVSVPGVLEASGGPIKPAHGGPNHRVRISIPEGIEFELAEMGSASTVTGPDSAIQLNLHESYGQFNKLRHSGTGVVRR